MTSDNDDCLDHNPYIDSGRRSFLSLITIAATSINFPSTNEKSTSSSSNEPSTSSSLFPYYNIANAAETIGKDESCNDSTCLGVWDGLLANCPHGGANKLSGGKSGCVSSQDDTPTIFAEPWDYSDNIPLISNDNVDDIYKSQMDKLILAIQTASKDHDDTVKILYQEGRYLRTLFTDGSSGEQSIGEFYFTPNDTTVQFRIGTFTSSSATTKATSLLGRSLSNNERSERIRKALKYTKVPVLRNRKRTFFFVESDELDGFGPGSAMLGPPEEMSPGELNEDGGMGGRTSRGSDNVDPKLGIDLVQSFPYSK